MFSVRLKRIINLLKFSPRVRKRRKYQKLLVHTISRCITNRRRAESISTQLQKDAAQHLQMGQEDRAIARVTSSIQEKAVMEFHDLLQSYCEKLIGEVERLVDEKECPAALKEAVAGLIYATSWCTSRMVELPKLRTLFSTQFGNAFVQAASGGSGVSPQLVEILSRSEPPLDLKLKILKEIASNNITSFKANANQALLSNNEIVHRTH